MCCSKFEKRAKCEVLRASRCDGARELAVFAVLARGLPAQFSGRGDDQYSGKAGSRRTSAPSLSDSPIVSAAVECDVVFIP